MVLVDLKVQSRSKLLLIGKVLEHIRVWNLLSKVACCIGIRGKIQSGKWPTSSVLERDTAYPDQPSRSGDI